VRAGVGDPTLPVKIDGVSRWRATSDVARRFQVGRVFLVGDAAHLMPPNGGFGGNTGIHDAHNLAWKLALVARGKADAKLLDTYEMERKPVSKFTVEQAYTRYVTRTAPYLGAKDFEPQTSDFNIELGYLYQSPAVMAGEEEQKLHDDPHETRARPGSRAPHVWLERRISSIDLFGKSLVLLAGSEGAAWVDAARRAAKRFEGIPVEAYRVGSVELRDPTGRFTIDYGITPAGAVLVRPDGFVAWRAKAGDQDPEATLVGVFAKLLGREAVSRVVPMPSSDRQTFAPSTAPLPLNGQGAGFVNPFARSPAPDAGRLPSSQRPR